MHHTLATSEPEHGARTLGERDETHQGVVTVARFACKLYAILEVSCGSRP
jgi:hypothetical protein